jgi:aspartate--ammonia ligase
MESCLVLPTGYRPLLGVRETEVAIREIKTFFQTNLAFELNLMRVTAPLFVEAGTGINDDLNGIERPVSFPIKAMHDVRAEIVQSLAKWKRMELAALSIQPGEGIYTDMNAIRADEELDNLHSLYVDQWDWELAIRPEQRGLVFLKSVVQMIYDVIRRTERYIAHLYPAIVPMLPRRITFLHSEELQAAYPDLPPKERERVACRAHKAVFVIGIGAPLGDGQPHDGRAPDYDDWTTPTVNGFHGLNGDILLDYPLLDCAYELSSMGIRVDPGALARQLALTGQEARRDLYFHRRLLGGELPLSIGGGIGQSRLCMFYLRKAHIGEIQSSLWPAKMIEACAAHNIVLL